MKNEVLHILIKTIGTGLLYGAYRLQIIISQSIHRRMKKGMEKSNPGLINKAPWFFKEPSKTLRFIGFLFLVIIWWLADLNDLSKTSE
jgi:hypothetical protein